MAAQDQVEGASPMQHVLRAASAQDPVEDASRTQHALRINWFSRDPGGSSTIYVLPPDDLKDDRS
jgi:hypothetical protein